MWHTRSPGRQPERLRGLNERKVVVVGRRYFVRRVEILPGMRLRIRVPPTELRSNGREEKFKRYEKYKNECEKKKKKKKQSN